MSLQAFLDSGRLKRHKASSEDIRKLFDVIKRDLADAIITADNSLIRTLSREDLELLLS